LLHQNQQFDFYDGGGLDLACLGMAEIDRMGNVNVSRFGPRLAGAGGFINISQNARKLVFAGTFTAGGLEVSIQDGKVRIDVEGRTRKFVDAVEQITFSGAQGAAKGQSVHYVTERCVFKLVAQGLQLIEVAPGIDVDRDILAHMAFRDNFKMAELFSTDVHQKVFSFRIVAINPLNRILHRCRQLSICSTELLQEHVPESRIGRSDAHRVHQLLYVVIHGR